MSSRVKTATRKHDSRADEWRKSVRAVMRKLDYTWADLGKCAGLAASTLRSECSRGFQNRRLCVGIEDSLGAAIFSTRAEFDQRQAQAKLLGVSPTFATRTQLRTIARRVGLVGATHIANKKQLVQKLCDLIEGQNAARPRTFSKTNTPR
jgi:hypothetical protein